MDGELWEALYRWTELVDNSHRQTRRCVYADADVARVYLWAVLHDRPACWACDAGNWPGPLRPPPPRLPSQPTLSRRLRHEGVRRFFDELWAALDACVCVLPALLVKVVDGKAMSVSPYSKDPDAHWGRGTKGFANGYKLHVLWKESLLPAFEVQPMNVGEATVARRLAAAALEGEGYLLGDSQFDSNPLHEVVASRGHQLLAPPKKRGRGLGHRKHDPHRLHALEAMRRPFGEGMRHVRDLVERRLGNLVSFGGGLAALPAWVRRTPRVRLWTRCKLMINGVRTVHVLERAA
jgi:hypothetical protein